MKSPRRRRLVGVLALVAGLVAGFVLVRRTPAPATALAPQPAAPVIALAEAPEMDQPEPSRTPRSYTIHTESVREPVPDDAPKLRPLGQSAAEDYRRRARFPASSHAIEDGVDPIARDREVTPGRSMGPEGHDPTLVVYPARTGFEAPNPVVVHAYLVKDHAKVDAREIRGEVRAQDGTPLAALVFSDDGRAGDAVANDFVYTAVLTPKGDGVALLKGAQLVEARARTHGDDERVATTGFLYSVPKAHLTGQFRDTIADGHLVVTAEVEVLEAGRFHLEATLASTDGAPVAWAQDAAQLDPGTAWMTLTYWGLALRERGIDGPYVVRSAALSTTGEMPNQKNDVLEFAHVTSPYRAAQFSDRPFNDPALLDAAARLEADAGFAAGLEAEAR